MRRNKSVMRALKLVSRTTEFSLFRSVVNSLLTQKVSKGIQVKPPVMPETNYIAPAPAMMHDASGNPIYPRVGADGKLTYI